MRIQPRRQILNVWTSLLSACCRDGEWVWGGRDGSNSISDAEQLLCILYPATEIPTFGLHDPDLIPDDVRAVLRPLGRERRIGLRIVEILDDYLQHYESEGLPTFSAGSYLRTTDSSEPNARQLEVDVVDSYSMSLTICLSGLQFLRALRLTPSLLPDRDRLESRIRPVEERLNVRLTAAMVGLVRSFVVQPVDPASEEGAALLGMFNQTGAETDAVITGITRRLAPVRTRLRREATLSRTPDLDDESLLFECGWSWGLVKNAPSIDDVVDVPIAKTTVTYAAPRPYLYFTMVALDGINHLTEPRTRELDLLNADQRRLADALQIRWDLAQRYWSAMARYGGGRWPLEDIPWRTSDGEESYYFSLCVSAVLIQDLVAREANDDDLARATEIFDELARRGRITRRVTGDEGRRLHYPGVPLSLRGTEDIDGGRLLYWNVADYATTLMKRTLQAARLSGTLNTRDRLEDLAELTMDHLEERAFKAGPAEGLWDDAARTLPLSPGEDPALPSPDNIESPSWGLTERVIECMVVAESNYRQPPLRSSTSAIRATELLNEADHLLNQKFLELSENDHTPNRRSLENIKKKLERARQWIDERPGTSHSLCAEALQELDELEFAAFDAMRGE